MRAGDRAGDRPARLALVDRRDAGRRGGHSTPTSTTRSPGPATVGQVRVLVVDNYDSFTYNLVQYLGELGAELEVVRNDRATADELLIRGYDRVIVSPGPCT